MKKMFKKLLSLSLACAMMLSMGITAFANDGMANAYIEHEDGTIQNLPVSYSVEMLPSVYTSEGVERRYALEASARATEKQEDNSDELGGVTARITLFWTDNFGINNQATGASGSWSTFGTSSVTGGRRVAYGVATSWGTSDVIKYPTGNSFYYNTPSSKGTFLKAMSEAKIKTTSGTEEKLMLEVSSSMIS